MNSLYSLSVMLLLFAVIASSPIHASEKNRSKFSLAVHFGINKPQAELKLGDFNEVFFDEDFSRGYALSNTGFGIGLKAVYGPGNFPVNLVAAVSTNHFSGSKTITYRLLPDMPESHINLSLNGQIVELSAGVQYLLFPSWPVKPFIGSGVALNFISGESKVRGSSGKKIESTTRAGIYLAAGIQYNISAKVFGEFYAGYHWANLFGKEYQTPGQNSDELPLNDGKNPNDSADISREINFLNFFVGFGIRI